MTTVADCDALLTSAGLQKQEIEIKKYQQDKKRLGITNNTLNIETERPALEAEIAAYETVIANLPEGDAKKSMESKLKKTQHKLFLLNEKSESYGSVAMNSLEFQITCIENDLVAIDDFIAQIQGRKAAL
ncbi:hypothetical protein EGI32_17745 [Ferruginibacter sp. HRS2-29]|nr:hypothetical protein [Ferruginibacter sp. HRS2-29]